jgi:hypothetical protein
LYRLNQSWSPGDDADEDAPLTEGRTPATADGKPTTRPVAAKTPTSNFTTQQF